MSVQRREVRQRNEPRIRLADEAQHGGNHDAGMADALTQPVRCRPFGTVGLQHGKQGLDLRAAAPSLKVGDLLVQPLLVEEADRLVAEPGGKG